MGPGNLTKPNVSYQAGSAAALLSYNCGLSTTGPLLVTPPPPPSCCFLQSQLDLLVAAVSGLRDHLQVPGNHLQVDLQLQGPEGVTMSPSQDETLKVGRTCCWLGGKPLHSGVTVSPCY